MTYLGILVSVLLAVLTWLNLFNIDLTFWEVLMPIGIGFVIDVLFVFVVGMGSWAVGSRISKKNKTRRFK